MRCERKFLRWFLPALAMVALSLFVSQSAFAGITFTGNVWPTGTDEWNAGQWGNCANSGTATITVDSGSSLASSGSNVGGDCWFNDEEDPPVMVITSGTGTVTVTGNGSTWGTSTLTIGVTNGSIGTLNIHDNGAVNVNTLNLAKAGTGDITVDSGGTLTSSSSSNLGGGSYHDGILGYDVSTSGTATVTVAGSGSTWTAGQVSLGKTYGSLGTLNVQDDGFVSIGQITIGNNGNGVMAITNGGSVQSTYQNIGNFAAGTVTVDGLNSAWVCNSDLKVSTFNDGVLNITNQGAVSVTGTTYIAYTAPGFPYNPNNTGEVNFGATGGTLSTKTLWASPDQLTGTGTIETNGLMSDVNLTFDAGHGLSQTVAGFNDISMQLDMSNSSNVGELGVGYRGDGTLLIADGVTVHSKSGYLGYASATIRSSGTATVDGAAWNLDGDLNVAYNEGKGTLNIQNGGEVTASGKTFVAPNISKSYGSINLSNGTLNTQSLSAARSQLTGTGTINTRGLVSDVNLSFDSSHGLSQAVPGYGSVVMNLDMSDSDNVGDLGIGYKGNGTLRIADAVAVTSQSGSIGDDVSSTSVATVTGSGSAWNVKSSLKIGRFGTGTLNILSGATVHCDSAMLAGSGYGVMNVDGPGSVFTTNTSLTFADNYTPGSADLQITNGGVVNSQMARLFNYFDITVDGANSTFNASQCEFDTSCDGAIQITNGGVFNTPNYVGLTPGSLTVTVSGPGSAWNSGYINYIIGDVVLDVNNNGTFSGSIGANPGSPRNIDIQLNGGIVKCSSGYIGLTGSDYGTITVGSQGATFDTNGGMINSDMPISNAVGATSGISKVSAGTLRLSGINTYAGLTTVQAGTLALVGLDVGTASAWDPVLTGGGADLQSGKLVFNYAGGTSPAGTIATILDDSYGTGSEVPFAQGNGAQIFSTTADAAGMALGWMDDGVFEVTVMYTLYGDSNLDGSVNGTDLNAVLSYYNQSSQVWACGDFNYDGSVNGTDLNTVLSNYNQSLSSSTAAVPEPSTLVLMVLGIVGLLVWRKRK